MTTLRIGGHEIRRGERRLLELPVARLPTSAPVTIPVHVVRGRRAGPTLFVSAAVHGDEINGVEILRRLLGLKRLARLRGTLLAVPVVNGFGFLARSRYLPDRRDLNRSFPGSVAGSLASRLAHLFMTEVVARATHGIDLHTAAVHRTNLPQVRITSSRPACLRLAKAFGAPVILPSNLREGSLRAAVDALDKPFLIYEGGEALRFDEWAIRAGVRGVLAAMETLEMLPVRATAKARPVPLLAKGSTWVRSPDSGILRLRHDLGQLVQEGELLATVTSPHDQEERAVYAPTTGLIVGRSSLPLVNEGDACFHLARLVGEEAESDPLEDFDLDLQAPFRFEPGDG